MSSCLRSTCQGSSAAVDRPTAPARRAANFSPPCSANVLFQCRGRSKRPVHRRNDRSYCFNPGSSSRSPQPNPHSARGAARHATVISYLGAFAGQPHQRVHSPVMPVTKNLDTGDIGSVRKPSALVASNLSFSFCMSDRVGLFGVKTACRLSSHGRTGDQWNRQDALPRSRPPARDTTPYPRRAHCRFCP